MFVATNMTRPLFFDERVKQTESARLTHVFDRWFKKVFPPLDFSGPSPGRLWRRAARESVSSQLLQRQSFPSDQWIDYGPISEVETILEIVEHELSLPNHNLIPDDPVVLLMSGGYDVDDVYALKRLENKYSVQYTDEERQKIRREDWTLGRFVADLLARASCE